MNIATFFSVLLITSLILISGCTTNNPEVIKVTAYEVPVYNNLST